MLDNFCSGNADRDARFRIRDIADKLSIALISHARNAARYALLQLVERVHASGISLAFRNGSVFLSDMILENVRVYPSIPPLHPYNLNGIPRHVFRLTLVGTEISNGESKTSRRNSRRDRDEIIIAPFNKLYVPFFASYVTSIKRYL